MPIPVRQENARRLREAGVRVVVGTDAGASLARFDEAVHVELELLVGAGWSPLEAIEARLSSAPTAGRLEDLEAAREQLRNREGADLADSVLDGTRPVGETARAVLELAGWTAA